MLEVDKIIAQYDLRPDWRTALEYEVRLATQTQAVFRHALHDYVLAFTTKE